MKIKKIFNQVLVLLLFITSISSRAQEIDYKGFPEWEWNQQGTTEYYLYTPSNLEEGQLYPIALFLHGCCGEDNHARLRNTVDPPVRMWHNFGENSQETPTYIISPATTSGWSQHFENLKAVIDDLIANHQGDPQRVYITGFSMGGRGTFEFIDAYPEYFAAAIPMGMSFVGSEEKVKDIPVWANIGELDKPNSIYLNTSIASIRALNDYPYGANEWITGVNPLYSEFDDVGHGVQWDAASSQDLVEWAFSKVNDGNIYPNVYFDTPENGSYFDEGEAISYNLAASDADGNIDSIRLFLNGIYQTTLLPGNFNGSLPGIPGDMNLQAIAWDNQGKTSTANITVSTDNMPVFINSSLPDGQQGILYEEQMIATGNSPFSFTLSGGESLPEGLILDESGLLKGIPLESGDFPLEITLQDKQGDQYIRYFDLNIAPKNNATVLVSSAIDMNGNSCLTSMLRNYELPFSNYGDETSISNSGAYSGMTMIRPDHSNRNYSGDSALILTVDEDVSLYIAYEALDNLYSSTIPEWLGSFTKEDNGQITAQYFYYDVYTKDYPAGEIILPGADAESNGVLNGYFVLVKKQGADTERIPEISAKTLSGGYIYTYYKENLSAADGNGITKWELTDGMLPAGIELSEDGILEGSPESSGLFPFTVKAMDEDGSSDQKSFELSIADEIPLCAYNLRMLDTAAMMNSGVHEVIIPAFANKALTDENYTIEIKSSSGIIEVLDLENLNDTSFRLSYQTQTDLYGRDTVSFYIEKKDHPVRVSTNLMINILSYINQPPTCNPVEDLTAINKFEMNTVSLKGISDGDIGEQNIEVILNNDYSEYISVMLISYTPNEDSAVFKFFPRPYTGVETISITVKDDGGNDLGGKDSTIIEFDITIIDPTSTDEFTSNELQIFPNPASDYICIRTDSEIPLTIRLTDINGRLLLIESQDTEINISTLEKGFYFVNVLSEGKLIARKKIMVL